MRQKIRKGLQAYMMLLFPLIFVFFSPYIIVASAVQGIVSASAVMFGLLLLFSVICSRLFCGWLCPAGAIQDQVAAANSKPWNGKWANTSKYVIWAVWFALIVFLWVEQSPLKFDFFNMTSVSVELVVIYLIVATLIYLFALFTGKRGMCHSLCWMAPFMVIGEKISDLLHIPRFRLKANSEACIACSQCTKKCPMSLDVQTMIKSGKQDSTECIGCLECVDVCPKKAIACGISRKR